MMHKFNRLIMFVTMLVSFISASSLFSQESRVYKIRVKIPIANIRLEPSLTAKIVAQAPIGTLLESSAKQGQWYKVTIPPSLKSGVDSGFIFESVIEVLSSELTPSPIQAKPKPLVSIETKRDLPASEKSAGVYDGVGWFINKKADAKNSTTENATSTRNDAWGIKKSGSSTVINKETKRSKRPDSPKGIRVAVGLLGELESTFLTVNENDRSKSTIGFGASARFALSPKLGLQFELNYADKGNKQEKNVYMHEWTLRYLELPALASYSIFSIGSLKAFLLAGPFVAIKLSDNINIIDNETKKLVYESKLGIIRSFDYGIAFGCEIRYSLTQSLSSILNCKYALGVSEIIKNEPSLSAHTSAFSINLGLAIQ